MVVTLNGAVFALEGTTDLQAIRSAFAAPIKGLGLAFGTSVAGVASSAMLGLMSAMGRRERLLAAQLLDTKIATVLRRFSLTHQRQEAYRALQLQSQALPAVVDQLQAMMAQMERMGTQLSQQLLNNQQTFHHETTNTYTTLARSVGDSLRESLIQGAQAAGESIRPVMQAAMGGISQETKLLHERMVGTTQEQLQGLAAVLTTTARDIAAQSQASAVQTVGEVARLMSASESLVHTRIASEEAWSRQHGERMDQVVDAMRVELSALRDAEALRGAAAVERLGDLQTALAGHLTTLGTALEEPIARLILTASEAPRAAAEVIGKLREEVSNSAARDNELLEERSRILGTLNSLLDAINHASVEQRSVIDTLVASSASALDHASSHFSERVDSEARKLSGIAAQVTGGAVEVSALSESFNFAVRSFHDANEKMISNLQRIESAMDKSMARSDDQLAYYVAQAREVIDLSITSQKGIVDELRHLSDRQALTAAEVA